MSLCVAVGGSCFCFSSHLLQSIWLFPSCPTTTKKKHIRNTVSEHMTEGVNKTVQYHRSWLALVEIWPQSIEKGNRQKLNLCSAEERRGKRFQSIFCFCETVPGTCLCLCHGSTPPPPCGFWTACRRCCAGPYSSPPVTTQQKHLSERLSRYSGTENFSFFFYT